MEGDGRPPFVLTVPEIKLLGIAGVRSVLALGLVITF